MLRPRVIYEARAHLSKYLTYLFKESLTQGVLPDEWKHCIITIIHKKGKKCSVENYRPISLTCISCKIMESLIYDQLMTYLINNKLLSDKQYGFIKNRSTVLQLLRVVNDWMRLLDLGKQVDIIYTDFAKLLIKFHISVY